MKKCLTCHRAGDQVGNCGHFMLCPGSAGGTQVIDPASDAFPQVDPSKDIVLECAACGQTVAMPAHDVMIGNTRVDFKCIRGADQCEARVVNLAAPPEDAALAAAAIKKGRRAPSQRTLDEKDVYDAGDR